MTISRSRISSAIFAILIWAFSAGIAAANNGPVVAPRPDWVEIESLPDVTPPDAEKAENGVYYLLLDRQVRVADRSYTFYRRIALRVTNQSGLEEAGRLEFVFDPEEDEFRIYSVKVIRDGMEIDRLDPGAFKVVQREPELSDGVTDGDLTFYYEIPDIRVGDIVDYEIGWNVESKIWPGEYFDDFSVEWSVPVALSRTKLILPSGKSLTIANKGTPPEPEKSESDAQKAYQWLRRNPPVVQAENETPETFATWSSVSVSTIASWREVAETLVRPYDEAATLTDALAAEIVPDEGSLEARITAAVRYVQDEIRYVADETGVGSHLPRSPETVVRRGWGDCKDKAALLVAILRRLGVEAYVALTDNDSGRALPQSAPSPFAFDHAIVVAVHDGERRWIDATMSLQGGVFPNIEPPSFGFGMAIKAGGDGLWPIDSKSPETPSLRTTEAFDFGRKNDEGVEIAVVSEYRGVRADSMRWTIGSESADSLSRKYLEYYEGLYPGVERKAELRISDNRDTNEIRVEEKYLLPAAKFAESELVAAFPIQADAVRNVVSSVNVSSRRTPVALPYPLHVEHIVSMKNTGVKMSGINEFSRNTGDFEFVRNARPEKDSVRISWRLKTLASELSADRIGDYHKLTEEMDDWNVVEYNLDEGAAGDLTATETASMFALAFVIVATVFVLFAGWGTWKADAATIDRSVLYPVKLGKFVALGVATLGLYAFFWMYRCWRQIKRAEDRQINAIFRAFFGMFFYFPLFDEIRRRSPEATRPPFAIGALLAVAFLVLSIVSNAASRLMKQTGWEAAAISVSDAAIFLLVVPLVAWTNRLNATEPALIAEHSRWKVRTYALLAFGVSLWPLLIVGALTPE